MTEGTGDAIAADARAVAPLSAGAMLRAARQAQGLHIAALSAAIKVPQRKLEALEADRLTELPDNTFARALAKTACRALKIDPAPVLALMPELGDRTLEKVHQGLNATLLDRPDRPMPTDLRLLKRPAIWLPLLIVLAAGFVFLMPQQWVAQTRTGSGAASAPSEGAAAAPVPAEAASAVATATPATTIGEPVATPAPAAALEPASAPSPNDATAATSVASDSLIGLTVSGESWVEVLDANGAVLLQRRLEPGEFVGLDGTPPFRLKIGNAVATRLSYRGEPVDLVPATRDNVARLELK